MDYVVEEINGLEVVKKQSSDLIAR